MNKLKTKRAKKDILSTSSDSDLEEENEQWEDMEITESEFTTFEQKKNIHNQTKVKEN